LERVRCFKMEYIDMMNMMPRIMVSLSYAVGITFAAYQATTPPLEAMAYIGLGVAFIGAFWGKFSSSTTVITPNRAGETLDTRPKTTL